jgi:predicted DNA-binding transcriptional regulator YafY
MIPMPSKVIGSESAGSLSRRSLFQLGLVGMVSGFFGRDKLLANTTHATEEALDPEWLVKWRAANRIPVWESSDSTVHTLVRAARLNQSVTIRYHGGSSPDGLRVIAPSLVFACDGFSGAWVSAYCHTRRQQRTFRLDCVSLE